ncbi:WD40-repeat-containing domain protein [Melampsora americana]|nr:WD40-repeat-containing domain protein [Melampsora americana]
MMTHSSSSSSSLTSSSSVASSSKNTLDSVRPLTTRRSNQIRSVPKTELIQEYITDQLIIPPFSRFKQITLKECFQRRTSSPDYSEFSCARTEDEDEDDKENLKCEDVGFKEIEGLEERGRKRKRRRLSNFNQDEDLIQVSKLGSKKSMDLLLNDDLRKPTRFTYCDFKYHHSFMLWSEDYEKGYEFPYSLTLNYAAKSGGNGGLLAVGSAMGNISFYNPYDFKSISPGSQPIQSIQASQNSIFSLKFSPTDQVIATSSGGQVSELFDVETGELVSTLKDHSATLKTVEFSDLDHHLIVTGARDGCIKLWDLRIVGDSSDQSVFDPPVYSPVLTIKNAHDEKHEGKRRKYGTHLPSVTSLVWSKHLDRQVFSSGSENSVIKLWDLRWKTPYIRTGGIKRPHGICSLISSNDGARLYILSTDISLDDQLLSCGSSNGKVLIWDLNSSNKEKIQVIENEAHKKEICGIEFFNDGLVTCADDGMIKVWKNV